MSRRNKGNGGGAQQQNDQLQQMIAQLNKQQQGQQQQKKQQVTPVLVGFTLWEVVKIQFFVLVMVGILVAVGYIYLIMHRPEIDCTSSIKDGEIVTFVVQRRGDFILTCKE